MSREATQESKGSESASTNNGPEIECHPSEGNESETNYATMFAVSGVKHRTVLAILPVLISQGDKTCATYCLYDSGSTGCFVSERLCDDMNLGTQKTRLKLKTMHGSSVDDSYAVDDLVVTDSNGDNSIQLPRTFSRAEIPVDPSSIPTVDDIKPYACLSEVMHAFPGPLATQVDLLIGSNCPRALEPLQVVSDKSCPLVAVRLRHGWTIFGSIGEPSDSVVSHRITHNEILTPDSLTSMIEPEFNERAPSPDELGTSVDDGRFLEMVENNLSCDGNHDVISLPLTDPSIEIPNDRPQVYQRLMLQRKNNDDHRKDYVCEEITANGFRLTKFVCNNREVLLLISPEERTVDLCDVDIFKERFPNL